MSMVSRVAKFLCMIFFAAPGAVLLVSTPSLGTISIAYGAIISTAADMATFVKKLFRMNMV